MANTHDLQERENNVPAPAGQRLHSMTVVYASKSPRSLRSTARATSLPLRGYHLLRQDRRLLYIVLSTTALMTLYGGYERFMPLVAGRTAGRVPIMRSLFALNAVIVVLVQAVPLGRGSHRRDTMHATLGFLGLISGFAVFSLGHELRPYLYAGTVSFSLGEGLLFPGFEIFIDYLAPEHSKPSYFALAEVKQVGFLLGPLVGDILYDRSVAGMFGGFTLLCIFSAMA